MKKFLVLLPVIVLIAVALYFIIPTSFSVRYWVDDFCSAALLVRTNFWNTQISTWNGWTGRFSATFFTSFFELIGPRIVQLLPLLLLGFLMVSLKCFYKISKILPLLFIFLSLVNAPNIIQSFYWQTGSLNYLASFIFLNIFLGLVVFPSKKVNIFLPTVLLFIAGGFSEAYALAQLVLLFFVLIAVKVTNFSMKTDRVRIVIFGIVGAILALGIILLAPGNAVRATTVTKPESLWFVINSTLLGTKWYLLRMLSIKPFIYSLFFLFTAVLVLVRRVTLKIHDSISLGILSIFAAVFATMTVIGSGFYSMSIFPPERTLFIAIYMIMICFIMFSLSVASLVKPNSKLIWVVAILNLITSFLLIKSVITDWSGVYKEVKTYAVDWDATEKNLPLLKNITPVGGLDSFTDNKGWVLGCIKNYYGLKDIQLK